MRASALLVAASLAAAMLSSPSYALIKPGKPDQTGGTPEEQARIAACKQKYDAAAAAKKPEGVLPYYKFVQGGYCKNKS